VRWPTWDEASFVAALLLAAAAFLFQGPLAGAVLACVAGVLALFWWTPLRGWVQIPDSRRSISQVSAAHRRQLQETAASLAQVVGFEQAASPGPDNVLWESFRAHFPTEAVASDAWDALVTEVATARASVQTWIRSAGAPLFAKAEAIPGRSEALIAVGIEDAISRRLAGEPDHLFLGGFATARVAPNIDQQQTKHWYEAFLAEALQTPEAEALEKSRRELRDAKVALLPELQRIGALHVIRGECDLCR